MEEKFDLLKEWYDGYRFGSAEIYCPWDVINQCDKIEALFSGEPVEKILVPELTYTDLDSKDREVRQTYLWKRLFNEFLSDSISIRDTYVKKEMKESFYHGMLLGLLRAEGSWSVKSNAESGTGYTDILLEIPAAKAGCIIEVKYAENGKYAQACAKAMKQIENGGYVSRPALHD